MKPHSCCRYRYICMYMSSMPDDVFKNSSCLGDRKRWRTTSLTVPEELKPPTSTQLTSPHLLFTSTLHCFFRLTHIQRERERDNKLVCVGGSLHALSHCGLESRHGGQKWNWFRFFFFFFFGSLFCFAFGPPPSGIVRRRPWTWTTSQWLAIKLY